MSSLAEIRPGVWKVRGYAGIDPATTRQRSRSRTFHADGIRAARKMQARIDVEWNAVDHQRAAEKGTVTELVDRWLRIQGSKADISPTYLVRATAIGGRIRDMLGHIPSRDLAPRHVTDWHVALREMNVGTKARPRRMAEATVLHHHRILSAVLTQALDDGYVDAVVTARKAPRPPAFEMELPSDTEMQRLLDSAPSNLRGAVFLAAMSGLRRGELFGLRWTDIEPGVIHVRQSVSELSKGRLVDGPPKSKRKREVWIADDLETVLMAWRVELERKAAEIGGVLAPDARVLPDLRADKTGRKPMRPGWLSLAWKRHCHKHGVHVRLHDCRHWFATRLLSNGASVEEVRVALGHAETSTTVNRYGHLTDRSPERTRTAMRGALRLGSGESPGT